MKLQNAFKLVSPLILLSSVAVLQFSNFQKLDQKKTSISSTQAQHQDQALQQQLSILLKSPDFGFSNLLADWVFLNFLQYFGDSDIRAQQGYHLNLDFFEVIIDRDPRFVDAYVYLANSISMYSGQPNESIRLLEKGIASLAPNAPPRSFFVWRHKATDELLFVGDTQEAKASYEMAAFWAEQSSDPEANLVARLSLQTVEFLETDPNSRPAQINAWSDILLRATDSNIKEEAISQIENLGGTILVSEQGQVTVRYHRDP